MTAGVRLAPGTMGDVDPDDPALDDPAPDDPVFDDAALDELRPLVLGLAYRMTGSLAEAEDIAQEALLRVHDSAAREPLRSPEAFATTVTTRLAIDHLRSARVRREAYVGPWLPEPVLEDPAAGARRGGGPWADGARSVELAESLSLAFLVVLESLGPVERAAFLLHDVFGYGYDELARALDRSEPACRQLVARARKRIEADRPRFAVDPSEHEALLRSFVAASRDGDLDALLELLTEDATLLSDGGPNRKAARLPIRGRERAARFLVGIMPRVLGWGELRMTTINGRPGFLVVLPGDDVYLAGTVDVAAEGRIRGIHWVLNPDKLRAVDPRAAGAAPGSAAAPQAGSQPASRATEL
jgi:RNA polymerase sigma-70 factor, ECF subfamily